MSVTTIATGVVLWGVGAYCLDVLLRPSMVADEARRAARARRKPLLNVGCGTSQSSLRAALFGPTLWGDINCDIAAKGEWRLGDRQPCYGDIHQLPFPDKYFGAVIASHVVEHVDDPHRAMRELHRVADSVFVIVPKWWAPHTWLHPGHQWFFDDNGQRLGLWAPEPHLGSGR